MTHTDSFGLQDGSFAIIWNCVSQADPQIIAECVVTRVPEVDRGGLSQQGLYSSRISECLITLVVVQEIAAGIRIDSTTAQ